MGVFIFHPGTAVVVPEVNAPSLWSGGIEWGPAETAGADGYWQASDIAASRTGPPSLSIAIAGQLIPATTDDNGTITAGMQSANWSTGRSDWLSTLSPNTASFTFIGTVVAVANDPIVLALMSDVTAEHSDALWVGRVDTVSTTQDTAGNYWTTVSGIDIIGVLGQSQAPTSVAGGTFDNVVETVCAAVGVPLIVETEDTLPTLLADTSVDSTALEYINRAELSANTLLFLLGNGHMAARQRKALVASLVDVIPLTGLDGYRSWTEQVSVASVINDWSFTSDGTYSSVSSGTDSIAAYGKHTFSVDSMLRDSAAYDDLILSGILYDPRPVVTGAEFPIYDLEQKVMFLDPLDWVDHDGDIWQVMSVSHDASPSGWTMTMTADQTQNALVGEGDPTPNSEPFTDTQTVTSSKSAYVVKQSGGSFQGSGADDYIPVGIDNGDVYRGLFDFSGIVWPANFVRVRQATFYPTTTTQQRVTFGSHSKVEIRRITNSWSEGVVTDPPLGSNAVIWPGPGTATAGQKVVRINNSEVNTQGISITEIAQGWHDDPDGHHGLRVASVDEGAKKYTIEFYSDDHTTHKPYVVIVCEVSA